MAIKHHKLFLASTLSLALVGCGGGGGNSGSSSDTGGNPSSAAIVINEQNMGEVAGVALMSHSSTFVTGGLGVDFLFGAEATPTTVRNGMVELAMREARKFARLHAQRDTLVGAQYQETEPCNGGGSISFTINVANPQGETLVNGDSVIVSFNNCREGGVTASGSIRMDIIAYSGDFDPNGSFTIDATYDNLRIADSVSSAGLDGTMRLRATATGTQESYELLSGNVTVSASANGKTFTLRQTDMILSGSYDYILDLETVNQAYRFDVQHPNLNGSGAVTTLTPLRQYWRTDDAPSSGKLKIASENGNVLYLTFQPNARVQIELDRDNNGSIDASDNKSVFELDPLRTLFN